jgi:hypothetical protein
VVTHQEGEKLFYQTILKGSLSDEIIVLAKKTNGYHDLEACSHFMGNLEGEIVFVNYCDAIIFDGHKYTNTACTGKVDFENGKSVRKPCVEYW